ncbi:MAG: phosphatase PAP2 family protein [Pseudomonadota bacterium]
MSIAMPAGRPAAIELAQAWASSIAGYLHALASELPGSFRRHAWLIALVAAYFGIGVAVSFYIGAPASLSLDLYLPTYFTLLPVMLLSLVAAHALYIVVVLRSKRPLLQLLTDLQTKLATPRRIANALPCLLFIPIFGGTFTLVKAAIPLLQSFSWDQRLEQWDRWLHGGTAPWEWLQPFLGTPVITHAIAWLYNFWFLILSVTWVWQSFTLRDPQLRMQYIVALLATWIVLGSGAALFFSSAGPCYFGLVTGAPDPYEPLMAYLREADRSFTVYALEAQRMLWASYSTDHLNPGAGISAMPSMHLASAMLFALLGWRTARWLGIVLTIFFLVILIGSVHLGWHYAVDGYAGASGAAAIWWLTGVAVRRTMRDPAASEAADPRQARLLEAARHRDRREQGLDP